MPNLGISEWYVSVSCLETTVASRLSVSKGEIVTVPLLRPQESKLLSECNGPLIMSRWGDFVPMAEAMVYDHSDIFDHSV